MALPLARCSSTAAGRLPGRALAGVARGAAARPAVALRRSRASVVVHAASDDSLGTAGTVAVAAGAVANPVMLYSLYVLQTTGAGLPPGPGGLYGAIEGVSYLVVTGIILWSIATKARTGSGLPAGPGGALGAVEGVSYLSLLAAIVVFGLVFLEKGSLPGITG